MAIAIAMPRLSDSMEEGTILRWLVRPGDRVDGGQPLVEIETDKASVVYEAQTGGIIVALHASEGESVAVGARIAEIGESGAEIGESVAETRESAAETRESGAETRESGAETNESGAEISESGAEGGPSDRVKASPLARRIAAELGVQLSAVAGSGPQGRVIRADVDRAAAAPSVVGIKGPATVHELTRTQRTVARRMAESRATVPDIELRVEVDAGELVALRERLGDVTASIPSLNAFIVKAVALALREFPRVNGAWRDGGVETYGRVNVGIAVAAEDALLVPTIFDADAKPVAQIHEITRTLADRVRDGSVTPAELSGATITVSNLGMYGIDSFSAVINPPQAAILAVGALRRRPVVDEPSDTVVARPTVHLTLACDHRVLNGVDGARFVTRVRDLLERPLSLLL